MGERWEEIRDAVCLREFWGVEGDQRTCHQVVLASLENAFKLAARLEAERDEAIALLRVCDAYLAWTDGKRLTELKTDVQAFLAKEGPASDGGAG